MQPEPRSPRLAAKHLSEELMGLICSGSVGDECTGFCAPTSSESEPVQIVLKLSGRFRVGATSLPVEVSELLNGFKLHPVLRPYSSSVVAAGSGRPRACRGVFRAVRRV